MDHLYIQFYNNYCHTGAGQWFTDTLNKWLAFAERMKPRGPLIFIGLPADTKGASGAQFYRPPGELRSLYQVRGGLFEFFLFLTPVVQRADNFIQRIGLSSGYNCYPLDDNKLLHKARIALRITFRVDNTTHQSRTTEMARVDSDLSAG